MALVDELRTTIDTIAKSTWDTSDGQVVPTSDSIGLGNKGVKFEATMLYADLADSTELAMYNRALAAEVCKAFLECSARIIIAQSGKIRSFDGDRIMGVYIGGSKNTNAVKSALMINYMFRKLLVPRFGEQYEVFRNGTLKLAHCSGVDTSSVLVARAGVRNNNDLIWVGQAPNIAAKLSTIREADYYTFITKQVFDHMAAEVKTTTGVSMWESRSWDSLPLALRSIYRSSWTWIP